MLIRNCVSHATGKCFGCRVQLNISNNYCVYNRLDLTRSLCRVFWCISCDSNLSVLMNSRNYSTNVSNGFWLQFLASSVCVTLCFCSDHTHTCFKTVARKPKQADVIMCEYIITTPLTGIYGPSLNMHGCGQASHAQVWCAWSCAWVQLHDSSTRWSSVYVY